VLIEYSSVVDQYLYRDSEGNEDCFSDVRSLAEFISYKRNNYIIQNYDFYPYLRRLFALIEGDAINSFNGVKNVFC